MNMTCVCFVVFCCASRKMTCCLSFLRHIDLNFGSQIFPLQNLRRQKNWKMLESRF